MSSIIRTIAALRDIRVGDYVRFHIYKLGYVVSITDNDVVRNPLVSKIVKQYEKFEKDKGIGKEYV